MKKYLFLLLGLCLPVAYAGMLSPTEKQMKDKVDSEKAAQINQLIEWVNMNSGTSNEKGVHAVGEKIRKAFEALGFKTRWVEEPKDLHRAGTLIAERSGKKGKRLLLIGHLDTVFPKDSPFQKVELKKHSAKGPGISDDKGGVVVMLYALSALQSVKALDDTSITIVLTGDEEDSGKPTTISRRALMEAAKNKDIALDFEPAVSLSTSTIARRGVSQWEIKVEGNAAHSATIFQKGVGAGAIFELSRVLNSMRGELQSISYLTFNPGLVLAGTKIQYEKSASQGFAFGKQNVVASSALAEGDFRYLSPKEKKLFEEKMQTIVMHPLPNTKSTITFQDGMPAMPPSAGNLSLLKQYSAVSEDLGQGEVTPFNPGLRGAADISYIADKVSANLSGLGPLGDDGHTVEETVDLGSLPIQTTRAAIFIYRLTHEN